jgi:hypothetical protein
MRLSDQQQSVVEALDDGSNVVAHAVPGGGKSTLLLEICKRTTKTCLIIAYNTQLASKMNEVLEKEGLQDRVTCFTFHGICTSCISLAPDDFTMKTCIDSAKNGFAVKTLEPDLVLLDEAQDMKPMYITLLHLILRGDIQYFVCGDTNQMIYDFDVDNMADTSIIRYPRRHFQSDRLWETRMCNISYRLSPQIVSFVNQICDSNIDSANINGEKVIVRVANLYKEASSIILKYMNPDVNKNMLLVSQKKSNFELTKILNQLSSKDINIHVSGCDDIDVNIQRNKLRISTWHSSKGMEDDTIFVIIPNTCKKNPMYVALTRSYNRLVVILDERKPNIPFCKRCRLIADDLDMDEATRDYIARVAVKEGAMDFPMETPEYRPRRVRCVDNWKPSFNIRDTYMVSNYNTHDDECDLEVSDFYIRTNTGTTEDVKQVYEAAVKIFIEFQYTGFIRCVETLLHPSRVEYDQIDRMIELGHVSRMILPSAIMNELLPTPYYNMILAAYNNENKTVDDYCIMALGTVCWNSYHYTMRQLLPVTQWTNQSLFDTLCKRSRTLIPQTPLMQFDLRVSKLHAERFLHSFVHVASRTHYTNIVWNWETSQNDVARAALLASMHPQQKCSVVNILTGEQSDVYCHSPIQLLDMTIES